MLLMDKLKFKYVLEATEPNSTKERKIETPWLEENEYLKKQINHSIIIDEPHLKITEQIHPNGFHLLTIVEPGKITDFTNWELDYIEKTNTYLPRVQ
ncbi:hypothetical protein [Macrococcus capreoli]|uniref:hypothetical protein n=1 Tax=Macrococcus capreoli TaxID=2982690 RepID=UPI0021D59D89|nr:hypothetical protein [Macrococcus sp. TMW 2.2395]MCU7557285.1 hypothetical protein [Macrococcus sp. TMW 2.2395]